MTRLALLALALAGCLPTTLPLRTSEGLPSLRARADHAEAEFVFDPSAGLPLISRALCAQLGCRVGATYDGSRATHRPIRAPLTRLKALRIGGHRLPALDVGVIDFASLGVAPGVDGLLTLSAFRDQPVTIERGADRLVIESPASLERRARTGQVVPIEVELDGPATRVVLPPEAERASWVSYDLPGRRVILGPPLQSPGPGDAVEPPSAD